MIRFIRNTLHPARYHGRLHGQRPPFFEGWYFKVVDATARHRLAFIPGIFWSGRPHSFVQVNDGERAAAHYNEYPVEAFWAAADRFEVHVGPNRFTHNEMTLLICLLYTSSRKGAKGQRRKDEKLTQSRKVRQAKKAS